MASDPRPLAGKLALVTGGSRGIGAAICARLAADGAAVAVGYSSGRSAAERVVDGIRHAGGEAEPVGADLASADGPAGVMAAVDRAFGGRFAGRLDVLVNSAGRSVAQSLVDATDEEFDKTFQLNVRAVFQLTRAAARRMTAGGRIINIGSNLGEALLRPDLGVYAASKFAVAGFTRAWSHDLGPRGITVNAVNPGPIDTDMNPADGESAERQRALTSVGRYGRPEEIAAAVAYLASPLAAFVNGTCLTVDGGQNA